MADDTGKTGQGDAYNEPIPTKDVSPLPESGLSPHNEPKQVAPGAIPLARLDTLLSPTSDELPPPKVVPPISVMPHPPAPTPPTPPAPPTPSPVASPLQTPQKTEKPVAPPPSGAPIPTAPAQPVSKPIPPEIERFIKKPTTSFAAEPKVTPQPITVQNPINVQVSAHPPISQRITPAPPSTPTPPTADPEPVILTETIREKSAPTTPGAPTTEGVAATEGSAPIANGWGPFRDNISNILNAIKLPERFDAKASGDLKKPHQEAPEPIIISESVKATPKQPEPVKHDAPAPLHFAQEKPPAVAAPTQHPASPATAETPDVGLPKHIASTFALPSQSSVTPVTPSAATEIFPPPPPTPPTPPVAPPALIPTIVKPASEEKVEGHSLVAPLRTFKEDLMHVVHDRKISLVSAVALEEDKKRNLPQPTPEEIAAARSRRRHIFTTLYIAATLTGLGIAALFGIYTVQNQRTTPPPNPNSTSIVFAEQTFSFPLQDLSASDIKRTLSQSRGSSNASLGSITRIVPTVETQEGGARAATTAEFFKALDLHVTDDLVRALSSEFFLGIHTIDKNSPVLIIPVYSYERAFAGMLAWEAAMNTDLAPAFAQISPFRTDENGLPQRREFEDVVMRNYDTRSLKDDTGAIQLYYSFPTPNVLIISENPFSFTEILSRLQVQRRL
jgi:hypothetical protein